MPFTLATHMKCLASKRGSVAIQVAVMMTVLVGFASLGIEMTGLLARQRQIQVAADSAAYNAALSLSQGGSFQAIAEARAALTSSGLTSGGVHFLLRRPPTAGTYAGNASAIEAVVSEPQTLNLSSLFSSRIVTIQARASALITPSRYCILALDPSQSQAVAITPGVTIGNRQCGIAVNSDSSSALSIENSVIDGPVNVRGGIDSIDGDLRGNPVKENAEPVADPYANVSLPPLPACTSQSGTVAANARITLAPGRFCAGWVLGASSVVTLAPGTYYLDGRFRYDGTATVKGQGVTLVLNGAFPINFDSGLTFSISAPATGPFAGLAIYTRVSQDFINVLNRRSSLQIKGAIYMPNQFLVLDTNPSSLASCTQVIAGRIQISNSVYLGSNCANTGVKEAARSSARLVM